MKFEVNRGKNIMERQYRVEDFLTNIKYRIKNYITVILKNVSYNNSDKFIDYSVKKSISRERWKTEVMIQMQDIRKLF